MSRCSPMVHNSPDESGERGEADASNIQYPFIGRRLQAASITLIAVGTNGHSSRSQGKDSLEFLFSSSDRALGCLSKAGACGNCLMSVGNTGSQRERRASPDGSKNEKITRLKSDLDGLERLQALQSTLIREIRRQLDELGERETKPLKTKRSQKSACE